MNGYTITRKIHFQTSRHSKKTIHLGEKPKRPKARTPRISKLMALAIHFEQILRDGHVEDMATLARYGQITRARMTQVMNLLLLAPDIQESILNLPKITTGREPTTISELNTIARQPDWTIQRQMWKNMSDDYGPSGMASNFTSATTKTESICR